MAPGCAHSTTLLPDSGVAQTIELLVVDVVELASNSLVCLTKFPTSIGPWIQSSSGAYFSYSSPLFNALDWVDMADLENWSARMMIQITLEGKDQK